MTLMLRVIEQVDYQYFPVLPEDYEGTSDRPGCETYAEDDPEHKRGDLLHCNIRLHDLTRLDHVVQGALRRCSHPLNCMSMACTWLARFQLCHIGHSVSRGQGTE